MSNYAIPNIPVLATQLNDTDLFEKADGPASGQSQRFTGATLKAYVNYKYVSGLIVPDNGRTLYTVNHGLGTAPTLAFCYVVCVAADLLPVGSKFGVEHFRSGQGTAGISVFNVWADNSTINLSCLTALVGNQANFIVQAPVGGSANSFFTSWSNWRLQFVAIL